MKNNPLIISFYILALLWAFSFSVHASSLKTDYSHIKLKTFKSKHEFRQYCSKHTFNHRQKNTLKTSYILGKKHGLGFSLAAIAWKESLAGEYIINVNDPSFGVHHILISTASKRANVKGIARNKLAVAIMKDIRLSASFAVQELLFWKKYIKGQDRNWINIWAAYNGGHGYKKRIPNKYGRDIEKKIKWLRQCLIKV